MNAILSFLFSFLFSILIGFWNAFMVSLLWRWFVVPLGVVPVGTLHMWGLILFFSITKVGIYMKLEQLQPSAKELSDKIVYTLVTSLAITFATIWGYVVQLFM